MANTTNFNWETPDDTDLVKDGALAIRTLGNAIDTSLVDLKGGTTGQVLSKTSNTDMDFTWVTSDDANAIQNAIVDAKGDLIAASAADTPARLAVGNNGETLVADSSATTGLRWQGDYAAGKNKIINGDFNINQRGFSSTTGNGDFIFDRFAFLNGGGGGTATAQTFTLGTAPVAGYEGKNYLDIATTGQTNTATITALRQRIESVRTFAGQTVTVSFWAKAASGTPNVAIELIQSFGTGGSPSTSVTAIGSTLKSLTTSWQRITHTVSVPSISGKTLGTNNDDNFQLIIWTSAGSDFNTRAANLGIQTATISLWGIQVEAGSVATAFQTATGTLAGELAAASRYYQLIASGNSKILGVGYYVSATGIDGPIINLPVEMRTTPTISIVTGTNYYLSVSSGGGNDNLNSVTLASESTNRTAFFYNNSEAAGTAGQGCRIQTNNAAAFLALQAEL